MGKKIKNKLIYSLFPLSPPRLPKLRVNIIVIWNMKPCKCLYIAKSFNSLYPSFPSSKAG